MELKRFVQQSILYPKWWRNIGTGMPRSAYLNLLADTIGFRGLYETKDNPIYKIYYWANRERFKYESMIIIRTDGSLCTQSLRKDELMKVNPYHFSPWYKTLIAKTLKIVAGLPNN